MVSNKERLSYQFHLIKTLREFFAARDFVDVMTPPMVECPVIEPHIKTMEVVSVDRGEHMGFLHTSPEFWMKHLLAEGFEKIFNINYCFRDEPDSPEHRNQFLMLEWYRQNAHYNEIKFDLQALIKFCYTGLKEFGAPVREIDLRINILTIQELFHNTLKIDILSLLKTEDLKKYIAKKHKDIPLPKSDLPWEDYYHLLFLNKVEPYIKKFDILIIDEYPNHLSALAQLKKDDPRVCERFEIYIKGIEIANCYGELTNVESQKQRFQVYNQIRKSLYFHEMPYPSVLMNALEKGIQPSTGIALGVERLLMGLVDIENPFFEDQIKQEN